MAVLDLAGNLSPFVYASIRICLMISTGILCLVMTSCKCNLYLAVTLGLVAAKNNRLF